MKTYSPEELAEIIEKHGRWLNDEDGGERAYLRGADLRGADLRDADLRGADLRGAYLRGADLRGADLRDADLRGADLRGAYLCGADPRGADLRGAYLCGADLRDADLRGADLRDADLRGAYLRGADLRGADLRGAYLCGADLRDADLRGAYLGELRSLWGASGNCSEIKAIQCDTWPVTYTATHMQIGCQLHTLKEWWAFGDDEIGRMDKRAIDWWKVWKPILRKIIKTSPAVPGGEKPAHSED